MTERPSVEVAGGALRGVSEDGLHIFRGVPYARPPVGPLRWRAPEPPVGWEGVRDATRFGDAAPQAVRTGADMGAPGESEDCLYLNVWTETLDASARQPVLLWIHGGGNLYGAASEAQYDGAALARRGVTLVSFNYRLGVFGFLAHPDMGANFAVLDYVAALRWVRDNVAAFGGDPGNVTIFGQSAGAVAVRTLLACPAASGLFHRGVIQSAGFEGTATGEWWSRETNEAAADELFDRLGTRDPEALRAVPTEQVLQTSVELSGARDRPGHVRTPAQLVWMPVVDGETVVGDAYPAWGRDVPVMLGTAEHESRFFLRPEREYDRPLLERMTAALAGLAALDALRWFDEAGLDAYEALDALVTTTVFTEPASETLAAFSKLDRDFCYYHFTRLSPGAIASRMLAAHAAELPYLFGTLGDDGRYDETDRALSDALQETWMSFARTGVPGGPDRPWPRFDAARPEMTVIGDAIATAPYAPTPLAAILKTSRTGTPPRPWLGNPPAPQPAKSSETIPAWR